MTRSSKFALALLAVAVLAFAVWRWQGLREGQQKVAATAAAPAEAVVSLAPGDVVVARTQELLRTLPISGTLRAADSAVVKARASGGIGGLSVREGDSVVAGQVLARIESTEYTARLDQVQRQADAAGAQAQVAQRNYDNNRALVAQGFISKSALDTSQSNLDAAKATFRAAQAAVDLARKSLDDTVVRAPIAGQVAQRFVQPGERVNMDARIVEIVDLRRIEVEATLGAADSVMVKVGMRAQLQVEGGGAAGGTASGRSVGATVERINPSVQAGSRGVVVYLQLDRSDGLRQGLFVQGTIAIERQRALALPLAAVRIDQPAPYVQAIERGRVVHRSVETGVRGEASRDVGGDPSAERNGVASGASGSQTWIEVHG
ncbi:MAG: efflux RND transporter periplasmic adaptor subunit, partial [Variovorax sp.]